MILFSQLVHKIDETTSTNEKVEALVNYFKNCPAEEDKLWVVALFSHRRPPRSVSSSLLRSWIEEITKLPAWLVEDTYHTIGDLAETLALLLPEPINTASSKISLTSLIQTVANLKNKEEDEKKSIVTQHWNMLNHQERFIFNKIITGGFRIGISQALLIKGLSSYLDVDEKDIAHRLMGKWTPENTNWKKLLLDPIENDGDARPYPFLLAYAVENDGQNLENIEHWAVEHKWDGIRSQIIKRNGQIYIWSRGEELMTDKFPEFEILKEIEVDNFVMDGEIIAFNDKPLNFQLLQTRIGRKNITKNNLAVCPVVFFAYDLLEENKLDIRSESYQQRRLLLDEKVAKINLPSLIKLSTYKIAPNLDAMIKLKNEAPSFGAEGIMIKNIYSTYEQGRKTGLWWKWKVDPFTVDAVMIYAQKGHGRRANLFTDFTFAVWQNNENGEKSLVPFTKAYSGLTDIEFEEITQFVKKNTIDKFGPVYSVKAELVFELAFEGIALSKRHKSGIALRFPRMKAWRKDKKADDADELDYLLQLVKSKE